MRRTGFSLLEMIIVLGLLSVVAGLSIPVYQEYQIKNDLQLATEQVTQGIERARLLSQASEADDAWGFYVPAGVLFKGERYVDRDASFDEVYPMPSTIKVRPGLYEVSYSKVDGYPSQTGEIVLATVYDEEQTISIEVATPIAVTPVAGAGSGGCDAGEKEICHIPRNNPGNRHTLCIDPDDWPAHRGHGDTEGACAVENNTPVPPVACADRFSIDADGTIIIAGELDMTVTVLGSSSTFGIGGPEIAVDLSYNDHAHHWEALFNGADVDGGEMQIVQDIPSGSHLALKMHGEYKQSKSLGFKEERWTNDGTGYFPIFRNGAPLPNYPFFDQPFLTLPSWLQSRLNGDGTVNISPYELLLLGELVTQLTDETTDFQDAAVLLQFGEPTCP